MANWTTEPQPFGANRAPLLAGLSVSDGVTPVPVAVDPATGRLLTSTTGGGAGGTQYQELATTTPATGTLALGRYSLSLPTLTNGQMNEPMLDSSSRLLVNVSTGTVTANAGTNLNTSALALETGGNLASIKTNTDKIPALGQALAASSVPVVLTAAQITTLTPPTNTGYALDASLTTIDTDLKSNITLHAGTNLIGKVGLDQTTPGTTNAVAVAQIGANTVLTGNGITGTGSQRVTVASDNTPFAVKIDQTTPGTTNLVALTAETTKVIGVTRTADGSGNLLTSTTNALDVNLKTSAASNISTNVAQMNGVAVTMGNGVAGTGVQRVAIASDNTVLPAVGAGATASAVPANASYTGFNAATALPTAATAGNTTGGMSDKFGRQVVLQTTVRDLIGTQTTTISASTSETTIVTAAASVFNDLLMLIVSNTSASTTTRIDFRDTTAGSILFSLFSPAGDTRGFNVGGIAIPQTAVNTNWTAQCATSTTDIRIYAVFAKNK